MENRETFERVLEYLKERNSSEQIFNSSNTVGDNMSTIIKENGISLLYCEGWEYYEILGLTTVQEEELKEVLTPLNFDIEF